MNHRVARTFEQLLNLFLPSRGRHRLGVSPIVGFVPPTAKTVGPAYAPPILRGEDSPSHARTCAPNGLDEERRMQRQRRRDLWFASYGIDLDTRDIHSLGSPDGHVLHNARPAPALGHTRGQAVYLVGDGTGKVSRLADNMEAMQLGMAAELIEEAQFVLDERNWTPGEFHLLAVQLAESLCAVHRVAESRGSRLPSPAYEGPCPIVGGRAVTDT